MTEFLEEEELEKPTFDLVLSETLLDELFLVSDSAFSWLVLDLELMAVSLYFSLHPLMVWLFTVLFPQRVVYVQYVNEDKQTAKLVFHKPGSERLAPLIIFRVTGENYGVKL